MIPTEHGYFWARFKSGDHCPSRGELLPVRVYSFESVVEHDDLGYLKGEMVMLVELHGTDDLFDLDEFEFVGKVEPPKE
jgi:hypothetical protein